MPWLWLVAGTVVAAELLVRLPWLDRVRALATLLRKIHRVLRSQAISDHWKERVMLAYAGELLRLSSMVCALMLTALAPVLLLAALHVPVMSLVLDPAGMAVSVAAACTYVTLRRRLKHG